ncbi:MAG: hypothetical protein JWO47_155 [Candidatus Saccharibacteria bacterium]|nr:hypothetical protein [Candidatus Saccharibacteria bacterium]
MWLIFKTGGVEQVQAFFLVNGLVDVVHRTCGAAAKLAVGFVAGGIDLVGGVVVQGAGVVAVDRIFFDPINTQAAVLFWTDHSFLRYIRQAGNNSLEINAAAGNINVVRLWSLAIGAGSGGSVRFNAQKRLKNYHRKNQSKQDNKDRNWYKSTAVFHNHHIITILQPFKGFGNKS